MSNFPKAEACVESINHIGGGEYIVTWVFVESLFPITVSVTVDFEPADPSVGYMTASFNASGDAPYQVLEIVANEAMSRMEDAWEDAQERSNDD